MIKFVITSLLLAAVLGATSYQFTETRYSDALDKSMVLKGEITFSQDALAIKYSQSGRALNYEDGDLEYFVDGELAEVSKEEAMKIAQYFELIILLYTGDEDALNTAFEVTKEGVFSFLIPLGEMQSHVAKIKLKHDDKRLKIVKLFLNNSDNITISIEDEIR